MSTPKPIIHRADSKKKPHQFDLFSHPSDQPSKKKEVVVVQTHTTAPFADSKKKPTIHRADSKKKPREFDLFSYPSHQPPQKKEKKIREKLGLTNLEMALSQASLDESKAASATSASITLSLMKAAVSRAKVEIKSRDDTITELDNKILELQSKLPSVQRWWCKNKLLLRLIVITKKEKEQR